MITRQEGFVADGCDVVRSTAEAVEAAAGVEEIMVIGGSQIYAAFLPIADRVYLTRVHTEVEGDAFFPSLDETVWRESGSENFEADESNDYACTVSLLSRM